MGLREPESNLVSRRLAQAWFGSYDAQTILCFFSVKTCSKSQKIIELCQKIRTLTFSQNDNLLETNIVQKTGKE